jgi:hypothetical protein
MDLLRLKEVQIGPNDRVYRHARMRALIVWLVLFAAIAGLFFKAYTDPKWKPGYFFASLFLLFLLLMVRMVTARFHPSNWLVRMNGAGIYVQYRSYLNYDLPPDDPSVAFLPFGEIASARLVKERETKPDPMKPGANQMQFLHYVEFELRGDTATLAAALGNEHGESAPMKKHWYGSSSTLYRDYPVAINTPPYMRIRWDVVPGAKKFLEALRPYVTIADTISLKQGFTRLPSLSPEDQKKQLRELVQRGDMITASYLARKLYGGSLADAVNMVDGLQRGA